MCVFVCVFVFQGFYMYIETSRPRKDGDQARLISPLFNVAPKNPYGITNPPAYCFGFFYHMYGKHIGKTCFLSAQLSSPLSLKFTDKPMKKYIISLTLLIPRAGKTTS